MHARQPQVPPDFCGNPNQAAEASGGVLILKRRLATLPNPIRDLLPLFDVWHVFTAYARAPLIIYLVMSIWQSEQCCSRLQSRMLLVEESVGSS